MAQATNRCVRHRHPAAARRSRAGAVTLRRDIKRIGGFGSLQLERMSRTPGTALEVRGTARSEFPVTGLRPLMKPIQRSAR